MTPRGAGTPDYEILGSDGVAIAGDAFDGRIVHHLVAPELGLGASYRTPYGKILPMPTTFYSRLERWHYLSMLKAPATMNKLRDLESQALEPQKIASFIHIVANDLAYSLFVAVERAKVQLSERDAALFAFTDPPLAIEKTASRPEFERWIGRERDEIARCVDGLVVGAGIQPARVDTVFLTGAPRLFRRFGKSSAGASSPPRFAPVTNSFRSPGGWPCAPSETERRRVDTNNASSSKEQTRL